LSVSGVQLVPPLVVFQMPPHGVPTNNVLAFRGSATTGPTAPATFPFGGASPLCTVNVGPKLGAGPCVTKFWLIWSCAVAAVGNANAAAMTNPRNGPNMARPPSPYELTIALLQCAKEIWQRVVELDFASLFLRVWRWRHMPRCDFSSVRTLIVPMSLYGTKRT
jgi:hypothetical protein